MASASAPTGATSVERPTWQRLLLVGLSVCAMVLCCPDYDIWWLAFVAWVPYFAAIEGLRPGKALLYGWLVGVGTVFWGFFWLTELLVKFAGFSTLMASPVALLFALWHGLIWGTAAAGIAWLARRAPAAPLWLTAPLCWVAAEAVLPNIFPIYMALAWAWQPLWIQTAEIGGVTTISATMVVINAGLYGVLRRWWTHRSIDRRAAAIALGFGLGVPIYGAIRIAQMEDDMREAETFKVGVVQGNMSIKEMGKRHRRPVILQQQQRKSRELQEQGAQLIVWGETAYPNSRGFSRQSTRDLPEGDPWKVQQGFDTPIIFGAVTRDATGESPYPWNTVILLDEEGRILDTYDKVYRLIFGEYIPLVDPEWYLSKIPRASHLEQGPGAKALELDGVRLGPFICYEDILPRYVREAANQRVHILVNSTNDAWFGKTDEPAQHLGLAIFRAVEHRRPMVRAVNTGISTYIDPAGRAQIKTRVTDPDIEGPQDAEGFLVEVPLMDPDSRTLYGWTGELFNALCVFGIFVLAWRRPGATTARGRDAEAAA